MSFAVIQLQNQRKKKISQFSSELHAFQQNPTEMKADARKTSCPYAGKACNRKAMNPSVVRQSKFPLPTKKNWVVNYSLCARQTNSQLSQARIYLFWETANMPRNDDWIENKNTRRHTSYSFFFPQRTLLSSKNV